MAESVKTCHLCGTVASNCCGKCKITRYCSATCQKQDWPAHKKICCKPTIVNSKLGGVDTSFTMPEKTPKFRQQMFSFRQVYLEQCRQRPDWDEEKHLNSPILSWKRSYWESEHNIVGCDKPVPTEDATITLRSCREGVEECIGYWPIAPHPDPSIPAYVYDKNNYQHESSRLTKEQFMAWGREAKKEASQCRMPPKRWTPMQKNTYTVTDPFQPPTKS